MSNPIEGKVILITGANRGIGKAFVEVFAEHGAKKIYAAARNTETLLPLVDRFGSVVVPVRLDLSDEDSISAAAEFAADVDMVINNGGVATITAPFAEDEISSLEYELDVNLKGLMRMARAFTPVLAANGGGVFGQVNSVVSMKAFSSFATYSVSKAAAYSYTQSLREALADQGTHVLSIHPGPIATDMASTAGTLDIAEPPRLVPEAVIAALEAGEFHVYTDTMARQVGSAYETFAKNIVEANLMEG